MDLRRRVAPTLLAALFALALPASASALEYKVDSTADEAAISSAARLTAGGKRTLRAAIEAANATTSVHGTNDFLIGLRRPAGGHDRAGHAAAGNRRSGQHPWRLIRFGEDGPDAPCAGIEGPSAAAALTVDDSDGVVIEGLSITGAHFGIAVVGGSKTFTVRNSWIGLKLNAAENGNVLGPPGPGFRRGDDRRSRGLRAERHRRQRWGRPRYPNRRQPRDHPGQLLRRQPSWPVGLPGGSQEMANGKDIEITDSTAGGGVEAKSNEIGATIEGAALASGAATAAAT